MPSKPLAGKTIILTGSRFVQSIAALIEGHGGKVLSYPLIEIAERIADDDVQWINKLPSYEWLIFTSQNAVSSFVAKCERHNIPLIPSWKIAAVGEKTAALLKKHGLPIDFMPSTYSADVFVKEFKPSGVRALFLRGSMAKRTIHEGTGADEWTVYETVPCEKYIKQLNQSVHGEAEPIVVFASPSAVEVYAKHIAPLLDWRYVKFASIGHVTTAALAKYGVTPIVQPKVYTMKAVIEQLILEETIQ